MAIDLDRMNQADAEWATRNLPALCGYQRVGECAEKSKPKQQGRDENKTEANFGDHLDSMERAEKIIVGKRCIRVFKLAGNTTYLPDFAVVDNNGTRTYIEIKGFMRDDAAVKLKVAARLYPEYRWLLVKRGSTGQWKPYEVTVEKGIARKPCNVEWINGA